MTQHDTPGPQAPAGWYPGPDGASRYWDGTQWLSIPAPPAESSENKDTAPKPKKRPVRAVVASLLVVLLAAGGIYAWKVSEDEKQAAIAAEQAEAERQAEEERKAEEEAAQAEEDARIAEEERQAAELAVAQEAEDAEREERERVIGLVEEAIKEDAEEDVANGRLTGPILYVSCSPVAGGSVSDLDQRTTALECFAPNKENSNGTHSGYIYSATVNWDEYSYVWQLDY